MFQTVARFAHEGAYNVKLHHDRPVKTFGRSESSVIGLQALIEGSLLKRGKLTIYENTVSLPNGFTERNSRSPRRVDEIG